MATTLLINAGRITGYVVAGTLVGAAGSGIFGAFDHSTSHAVLRWAAAVALGWIGLSMLEIVPLPAVLYRVATHVSHFMDSVARAARLPASMGLFLSGTVWGFLPCAMVYAALFYAMLSGSGLGGAGRDGRLRPRHLAGADRHGSRVSAAPPPGNLGVAAQRGRSCHHHGGHRQRRRDADEFPGVVPLRLTQTGRMVQKRAGHAVATSLGDRAPASPTSDLSSVNLWVPKIPTGFNPDRGEIRRGENPQESLSRSMPGAVLLACQGIPAYSRGIRVLIRRAKVNRAGKMQPAVTQIPIITQIAGILNNRCRKR